MDIDYLVDSPGGGFTGSRWLDASMRRRLRRLSSPSLTAFLTPAFDAVGDGGRSGSSSSSSGGLDLGLDGSLLRFRRTRISPSSNLEHRLLLCSPPAPPLVQVEDGVLVMGAAVATGDRGRHRSKCQRALRKVELCENEVHAMNSKPYDADWLNSTPTLEEVKEFLPPWLIRTVLTIGEDESSTDSNNLPADLQSPKDTILPISTPTSEVTPFSTPAASAQPPTEEYDDAYIRQVLYGPSRRPRLPIFKDICPE